MPTKARRQNALKSNSRPGKQFEMAALGSVFDGFPTAR
jgi:hypothetical protein